MSVTHAKVSTLADSTDTSEVRPSDWNAAHVLSAWEDLRFPATAINPLGAASPMTFDTTNIGFTAGPSGTTVIAIIGQMPHAWEEGTALHPHIHWSPTTTHTGSVLWRLEYKWTNIGATDAGSFTPLDVLDAGDGTAFRHQVASFDPIDGTGKTISSMLIMRVSRIGGDGSDDYTGDALLREFDIHYQVDSVGSDEETSK